VPACAWWRFNAGIDFQREIPGKQRNFTGGASGPFEEIA
jgi:hypothetical protein